jgi:hypothetical protein
MAKVAITKDVVHILSAESRSIFGL